MNERHIVYLLAASLLAVLLWRMTPAHAAPVDAAADLAKGTLGQPTVAPTIPASHIIGMSLGPDDGEAGPAWYTSAYPGARPLMPPIPSAVRTD